MTRTYEGQHHGIEEILLFGWQLKQTIIRGLVQNFHKGIDYVHVTICLEGLADVVAFYWLTNMVENNP